MPKNMVEYFRDWESEAFGFGYGTGEEHVLQVLKDMSELLKWNDSGSNYTYDYKVLESKLGPTTTWLLLNALCKNGDIDYGTSPRYGWFYGKGKHLIDFVKSHSTDELYEMTKCDSSYLHCFDDYCGCGSEQVHHKCKNNPFWNDMTEEEYEALVDRIGW